MDKKKWLAVIIGAVLVLGIVICAVCCDADSNDDALQGTETTGTTESTTLPTQGTTASTELTTAPIDETTTPTEETVISTEETEIPTESTTQPTLATTIPEETESTTAPTESTSSSQGPIVIYPQQKPTEETTQPTEEATKPTEGTTKPTEGATEPTEATTEPTEATTAPTEETTAPTQATEPTQPESDTMRNITTMELVQDMGIGINLGNTFESYGDWIADWTANKPENYITAWGSPKITKKIIQGYADAGFGVLRIPVHWMNLMADDCTLSADYMAAVKQTVDWALDAGMYVIINIHHDENGFFADFPDDMDGHLADYTYVWQQIATEFKDYGDKLIFESLNEEGVWDDVWNHYGNSTSGKSTAYGILNAINQAFVDTVRASGGNNAKRHLLIAGYCTDITLTCDKLFKMPTDPAGRCAVSVHYYTPSTFTILEEDASWGKCQTTWGTSADFSELNRLMDMLKTNFIDKGIPVIMGEYGCTKTNKDTDSVRLYLTSVCEACLKRDICPIMWDITGLHYDRSKCQMVDSTLHSELLQIAEKY